MKYIVVATDEFIGEFKKLSNYTQQVIKRLIDWYLVGCENPYLYGKPLGSSESRRWRYSIGDYHLVCHIDKDKIVLLTLVLGYGK